MPLLELEQSCRLRTLHADMREASANQHAFVVSANRVIRSVLETCLEQLPYEDRAVQTPVGATYVGRSVAVPLCAVSVVRAGESMEFELSKLMTAIPIGKLLIQRDKASKLPKLFYVSLPDDVADRHVILLEPMLATGGSALMAIKELIQRGVLEDRIIFANILASPEGVKAVLAEYPLVKIVTSSVEQKLNSEAFMIPGIGDFGDRYFGTTGGGGQNGQHTKLSA